MGGNARVIDRTTGEVTAKAEKIDLAVYSRYRVVQMVLDTLTGLNEEYKRLYKSPIWKDIEVVYKGEVFTGSTHHLMDDSISTRNFVTYKPIVGDIDLVIPENHKENFEKMMHTLEGKPIAENVKYLGQDRTDFGKTFLGVFQYKGKLNFQIDFEYGKYWRGAPSEWAKFSHSSDWNDVQKGIKGVHHKFLLVNLARAISKRNDILIATPSSSKDNVKMVTGKKADQIPRLLAFSVDRGLRVKYKPLGIKLMGKQVFKELHTEESVYEQNVKKIYKMLFRETPDESDLRDFKSFDGLISLISEKLTKKQITDLFEFTLQENLFGKHAQVIEKDSPIGDCSVKLTMVNQMFYNFPYLQKNGAKVEKLAKAYYTGKNWMKKC